MKATRGIQLSSSFKIKTILAFVLGSLSIAAPQAFALTGTVTSDIGLHIREEPRGKILGALPIGSTFEVLARDGKWLHVKLQDGRTVFVWNPQNANVAGAEKISDGMGVAPLIKVDRQPLPADGGVGKAVPAVTEKTYSDKPVTDTPQEIPIPPVRPVDLEKPEKKVEAVPLPVAAPRDYIANGNFRLRATPGTDGVVVDTLDAGKSKFRILERKGDWLKVKTADGKVGYVHGSGATEASACINGECARPSKNPAKEDAGDILAKLQEQAPTSRGGGNACVRAEILKAAKAVVRGNYGNRSHSKGKCALGVRQMLDRSGVNNGAGLGHAIDYHAKGILKRKGFVNKISQYTAQNAPPGAILVFSGPYTKNYLRNGRMSKPYGNYVGHVTVKGDDGRYYTDGRTVAPAIANRYLVGVYVPDNISKMPAKIRRKCQ